MVNYQIISDSCCDFTRQQYKDWNVSCVPLTLIYTGQAVDSFTEEKELQAFYDSIRGGEMPTTAAVNPEGWARVMEPIAASGQDIFCLTFSSGMSTTYQSAVIAARELEEKYPQRRICVVDSLCAALGQGLLLRHVCRKRDEGMDLQALTAWCEEMKLHLCHWVTVDDLNHLKRGGRISSATALVGGMLNIKPIIRVSNEGKLDTTAKARGRKAAMEYLADKMAQSCAGFDNVVIAIGHGDCPEDAAALEALVREKCPQVETVITGYIGGVIGAHTGPGVLALFFLGSER